MLSVVLGLFLLVTAGLKIHGLYTDPYETVRRATSVAALSFFEMLTAGCLCLAGIEPLGPSLGVNSALKSCSLVAQGYGMPWGNLIMA